jgi:hypothetical protein
MTEFLTIIEHGESRQARFLRRQRLQIALAVAAIEGILVLAGSIPWWVVLLAAAASVGLHTLLRARSASVVRQATWIAAVSQLVVVLVPILAAVVTALAVLLLVLIVLAALGALLRDRR